MGNPDLSAINYFRLYQFVSGEVLTRIDFIRFSGLAYEALAAPANLVAMAGDGSVNLDWDDNTEASLAGYNVYRTIFPGLSYTKLNNEPLKSSEYEDSGLSNGVTYYYIVRAQDTAGNESDSSEEISATPTGGTSVQSYVDIGAQIYPNPFEDRLYVRVEDGEFIRMFDLNGRLVKSTRIEDLDTVVPVGDLPPGEYIIEVKTPMGTGMYTLIKN